MAAVKQQTQQSSAAGAGPAPTMKKGTVAGSITTTPTAVSLAAYPHGGAFHPYTKPLDGAPTNLQPRLSAVIPPPSIHQPSSQFILLIIFHPSSNHSWLITLGVPFFIINLFYQNQTLFFFRSSSIVDLEPPSLSHFAHSIITLCRAASSSIDVLHQRLVPNMQSGLPLHVEPQSSARAHQTRARSAQPKLR